MKKAKILVPAIAALVLSSAAAVTGTVAWFEATLTAQTTSGTVTVINASEGNLAMTGITSYEDYGTTDGVDNSKVNISTLVDGSVNLDNGTVWAKTGSGDTSYTATVTGSKGPIAHGNTQTYRAAKYDIGFTYTFYQGKATTYNLNLEADYGSTSAEIAPALRIGLYDNTAKTYKVYAPFNNNGNPTAMEHVIDAKAKLGDYATLNKFTNGQSVLSFVRTNDNPTEVVTNKLTVWTWIEGSDDTCVNGKTLLTTEAGGTLKFTAVAA